MRKILIPLVLTVSIFTTAQSMRFIYQARMSPDLSNLEKVVVENTVLDVQDGQSVFLSENALKRDSLIARMRQTRSMDRSQLRDLNSVVNYQVIKNLSEQTVRYNELIGRELYSYQEDRTFDWRIQPETTTLGDYPAQKALLNFGGREWTAWFTTEVPISDGPYKFSGLPGLIVKIEDSTGEYSFDLKEAKVLPMPIGEKARPNGRVIEVKRKDFEKQRDRFRKDPLAFIQASFGSRSGRGGGSLNPNRQKEMQTRLLQQIQNSSNAIEKN